MARTTLQGLIGMLWARGFKRLLGGASPALQCDLMSLLIVLPVLLTWAAYFGLPAYPDAWLIVRVPAWIGAVARLPFGIKLGLGLLFGGTFLIFVFQEIPALWRTQRLMHGERTRDERLTAALRKVAPIALEQSPSLRFSGALRRLLDDGAFRVEAASESAALIGFSRPVLLASRSLIEMMDDQELEGVVAHELAHLAFGGPFRTGVIWFFRALQAFSPIALIAFRDLVESREAACDRLAMSWTRKPGALASALIKTRPAEAGEPRGARAARDEVLRRAQLYSVTSRVKLLLGPSDEPWVPPMVFWAMALVLGGVLWAVA